MKVDESMTVTGSPTPFTICSCHDEKKITLNYHESIKNQTQVIVDGKAITLFESYMETIKNFIADQINKPIEIEE